MYIPKSTLVVNPHIFRSLVQGLSSSQGLLLAYKKYEVYIAPKVATIVVGLLHRQFFYACALQHGNVHAISAGVR